MTATAFLQYFTCDYLLNGLCRHSNYGNRDRPLYIGSFTIVVRKGIQDTVILDTFDYLMKKRGKRRRAPDPYIKCVYTRIYADTSLKNPNKCKRNIMEHMSS